MRPDINGLLAALALLPGALLINALAVHTVQAAPGDEQLQHQQAQQKARQQRLMPQVPDVRLSETVPSPSRLKFPQETPLFCYSEGQPVRAGSAAALGASATSRQSGEWPLSRRKRD